MALVELPVQTALMVLLVRQELVVVAELLELTELMAHLVVLEPMVLTVRVVVLEAAGRLEVAEPVDH
jgi:hypothetical protein